MNVLDAAAAFSVVVACAGLGMTLANLCFFKKLKPRGTAAASVVACVAMRDEAENARACIDSLLQQPEIVSVVVCDDGSTDGTREVLQAVAKHTSRMRVVTAPGGSKNTALAAASAEAEQVPHSFLLFTDADVRFRPGAVGALIAHMRENRARSVTAWPSITVRGLGDLLVSPSVSLLLLHALPMWRAASGDPRFTAGNGQIFLVEREAYAAAGGHAAIRTAVEDVALAKALCAAGAPPLLASGAAIATARGYGGVPNAIRGLGRSLFTATGVGGCAGFAVWQISAFVLPLLTMRWSFALSATALCAALLSRVLCTLRMNGSAAAATVFPVASAICACGALAAAFAGARGNIVWRGRSVRI